MSIYCNQIRSGALAEINTATSKANAAVSDANAAKASATEALRQAEQAIQDANNTKNSIPEAVDKAVEEAISAYDFVTAIQENVAEDVMLKSEYEETIGSNAEKISELSNAVEKLTSIPIITGTIDDLPHDAKNGDLCLWSEPNSLDSGDSGGRICIEWDSILNFVEEFKNTGTESEYLEFNITERPSWDYLTFIIERFIEDTGASSKVTIYGSRYEEIDESDNGKTPCKTFDIYIAITDSIIDSESFISCDYYPTDSETSEDKYTEVLWSAQEDLGDLSQLPKSIDLGLLRVLDTENSAGDLQNKCTLFYSPYRLMVYRNGWVRLNNSTSLNLYNINH